MDVLVQHMAGFHRNHLRAKQMTKNHWRWKAMLRVEISSFREIGSFVVDHFVVDLRMWKVS